MQVTQEQIQTILKMCERLALYFPKRIHTSEAANRWIERNQADYDYCVHNKVWIQFK